jgi:hypothetical protein
MQRQLQAGSSRLDTAPCSPCAAHGPAKTDSLCCLFVFLQRYDPVTTGLGSLLVTGYCVVAHHQSVGEALNIAACATVLGMVGFALQCSCSWAMHLAVSPACICAPCQQSLARSSNYQACSCLFCRHHMSSPPAAAVVPALN